jgi:hypothetical protein
MSRITSASKLDILQLFERPLRQMTTQDIPMKQHFEAKPLRLEQKQLVMNPNLPLKLLLATHKTQTLKDSSSELNFNPKTQNIQALHWLGDVVKSWKMCN